MLVLSIAALCPPAVAVAQIADPSGVAFTLQACRSSAASVPATGPFTCADDEYTTGALGGFWHEGDLVPFRMTAVNRGAAQTYGVVIAADYRLANALGYDHITAPKLNAALSTPGCTELVAGGLAYAPPAGAAVGGSDETIYRSLSITQPAGATCVYDYAQRLALAFVGRTAEPGHTVPAALGAADHPGPALRGYLLQQALAPAAIGVVALPVDAIRPQGFGTAVEGVRGSGFAWGLTQSSGPVRFTDTCAGATTSGPMTVRVEWTKTAIESGKVAVTTTVRLRQPGAPPAERDGPGHALHERCEDDADRFLHRELPGRAGPSRVLGDAAGHDRFEHAVQLCQRDIW